MLLFDFEHNNIVLFLSLLFLMKHFFMAEFHVFSLIMQSNTIIQYSTLLLCSFIESLLNKTTGETLLAFMWLKVKTGKKTRRSEEDCDIFDGIYHTQMENGWRSTTIRR